MASESSITVLFCAGWRDGISPKVGHRCPRLAIRVRWGRGDVCRSTDSPTADWFPCRIDAKRLSRSAHSTPTHLGQDPTHLDQVTQGVRHSLAFERFDHEMQSVGAAGWRRGRACAASEPLSQPVSRRVTRSWRGYRDSRPPPASLRGRIDLAGRGSSEPSAPSSRTPSRRRRGRRTLGPG